MRALKALCIATLLTSPCTAALAADMPLKAAPFPAGGYPTKCGAYYGINVLGSAAPIADSPVVGTSLIGGDVGGLLGYTCNFNGGLAFWFAEVIVDAQNLNGGAPGFNFGGPVHIEERLAFGSPIGNMLGMFPNLNLPAVPSLPAAPNGITSGTPNMYLYAAVNEDDISAQFGMSTARDWLVTPEVGIGAITRFSNNVVGDAWVGAKMESDAICITAGVSCPKMGMGVATGFALKY